MNTENVQYLVDSLNSHQLQKAGKLMQLIHGGDDYYPFSNKAFNMNPGESWNREIFIKYFESLDANEYPIIVTAIESSFLAIVTTLNYKKLHKK